VIVTVPTAPPSAAPNVAPVAPASPAPPVDLPSQPACVLRGSFATAAEGIPLRLREGGPPFATARFERGEARFIEIPVPTRASKYVAVVDAEVRAAAASVGGPSLHLTALAQAPEVPVYAQRALRMGLGMVVPKPDAPLAMQSFTPYSIVVGLPNVGLRIAGRGPGAKDMHTETVCTAVGLVPREPPIEPSSGLQKARVVSRASPAHPPPLVLTAFAAEPGAEVGDLEVTPPTDVPIDVLETRGSRASVRIDMGNGWVLGWLDRHDLSIPFTVSGADGPLPVRPGTPLRPAPAGVQRCDHPVPVEARVGGDARTVGTAPPGTPIVVLSTDGPSARIELPAADLQLAPDAEMRTAAASLAGCTK